MDFFQNNNRSRISDSNNSSNNKSNQDDQLYNYVNSIDPILGIVHLNGYHLKERCFLCNSPLNFRGTNVVRHLQECAKRVIRYFDLRNDFTPTEQTLCTPAELSSGLSPSQPLIANITETSISTQTTPISQTVNHSSTESHTTQSQYSQTILINNNNNDSEAPIVNLVSKPTAPIPTMTIPNPKIEPTSDVKRKRQSLTVISLDTDDEDDRTEVNFVPNKKPMPAVTSPITIDDQPINSITNNTPRAAQSLKLTTSTITPTTTPRFKIITQTQTPITTPNLGPPAVEQTPPATSSLKPAQTPTPPLEKPNLFIPTDTNDINFDDFGDMGGGLDTPPDQSSSSEEEEVIEKSIPEIPKPKPVALKSQSQRKTPARAKPNESTPQETSPPKTTTTTKRLSKDNEPTNTKPLLKDSNTNNNNYISPEKISIPVAALKIMDQRIESLKEQGMPDCPPVRPLTLTEFQSYLSDILSQITKLENGNLAKPFLHIHDSAHFKSNANHMRTYFLRTESIMSLSIITNRLYSNIYLNSIERITKDLLLIYNNENSFKSDSKETINAKKILDYWFVELDKVYGPEKLKVCKLEYDKILKKVK